MPTRYVIGDALLYDAHPMVRWKPQPQLEVATPMDVVQIPALPMGVLFDAFVQAAVMLLRENLNVSSYLAGSHVLLNVEALPYQRAYVDRHLGFFVQATGQRPGGTDRWWCVRGVPIVLDPEPAHAWRVSAVPMDVRGLPRVHAYLDIDPEAKAPLVVEVASFEGLARVLLDGQAWEHARRARATPAEALGEVWRQAAARARQEDEQRDLLRRVRG